MVQMTFPPLEQLLPHRSPMILLTRMVESTATTAACEVDIRPETQFCDGESVAAYVGIEYMAQAIGAFSGFQCRRNGQPIEVGFLISVPEYRSYHPSFKVGQTLRVEVTHAWGENQVARFQCTIKDAQNGKLLQQAELSVFKPESLDTMLQGLNR
jgi:predicted hotdog family 3-hydroxylacyl-ACP dehydratase